jgi:hypothetical protein
MIVSLVPPDQKKEITGGASTVNVVPATALYKRIRAEENPGERQDTDELRDGIDEAECERPLILRNALDLVSIRSPPDNLQCTILEQLQVDKIKC